MSSEDALSSTMEPVGAGGPATWEELPRCGRWRVRPFELARPVLLEPGGPLTLARFLAEPRGEVVAQFAGLDYADLQRLVLARLGGAPPSMELSLFGEPGYSMAEVRRHVLEGTPLGVRIIEAERKLVGLLLTEAVRAASETPGAG